jgi:hypothetical protein
MLAGCILLLNASARSQTYNNVNNLSGTTMVAGVGVTVTQAGLVSSFSCSGVSQPYLEGQDIGTSTNGVGSYTWSFSSPVSAIRLHIESIDAGDDITISVNGVPYTITAANINPLLSGSTCLGSTGTAVALAGNLVNSGGGTNSATVDIMPGYGINSITVQSLGGGSGVINDFMFAPNHAPSFTNGSIQHASICGSSPAYDISGSLAVADADMGQSLTWNVVTGPMNGTTGGFPETMTTNGGTLTPSGLSYTPTAGFSGMDTIIVQATDGINSAIDTVVITVKPKPSLTSGNIIPAVCSGDTVSYMATGPVAGTIYSWTRAAVSGISDTAMSGTGDVHEVLTNITYYDITATYVYTSMANGCAGDTQNVTVDIKPIPILSSKLADTVCYGGTFHYLPTSATSATTFTWSRDSVGGITPVRSSGIDSVNEALTNSTTSPVNTIYAFLLNANGCIAVRNVTVTVDPAIAGPALTTVPPSALCVGTANQNFGTAIAPGAGVSYTWSAVNANIIATSGNGQNAIVSFNNTGNAQVILTATIPGSACLSTSTYDLSIGMGENPTAPIIYYNYKFVYLDNTVDSYQWGYDDVTTLAPTTLVGQEFQSYPNSGPDFFTNYYWVVTTKNGCTQKTYYNSPLSVHNVPHTGVLTNMNIFPNPANGSVTIDLDITQSNNTEVSLINMLGQTVKTISVTGRTVQVSLADVPAGCYLVSCIQNGIKTATGRFIKN